MTTASHFVALSCLFIIWLTGSMILEWIIKTLDGRRAPKPAPWPPPRTARRASLNPWGPPNRRDMVHTYIWTLHPENRPPDPSTRVA